MSSLASDTSKGSSDPSPSSKLDQASLGEHTKRTQGNHPQSISKNCFVNSWVASQTTSPDDETDHEETKGDESSDARKSSIPMIVFTDADEDSKADPPSLDSPETSQEQEPKRKTVKRRGSLDFQPGQRRQSPKRPLTFIDQPILEEPEDGAAQATEAPSDKLKLFRSAAVKLTSPAIIFDDPQPSSTRQRARSYPATQQQASQPMLKLPHRVSQEQQKQETLSSVEEAETKISKFVHMAIMAKKWKNRSDSTGGAATENNEESIAVRQKKRPYIEVPRALKLEVLEDAYPIVQKTYQMYKSYLGPKHKLSELAEQHLERLNIQLGKKGS